MRVRHYETFSCKQCGKEFKSYSRKGKPRVYCSPLCQTKGLTCAPRIEWTCERCGETFVAYRKGKDPARNKRKFCSWACSNAAHARNVNDIRSRIEYEYELIDEFFGCGWAAQRVTGGRGPFDVFAWSSERQLFVQVKSTNNASARSTINMCVGGFRYLATWPKTTFTERILCLRIIGRGWVSIDIRELPEAYDHWRGYIAARIAAGCNGIPTEPLERIDYVIPSKSSRSVAQSVSWARRKAEIVPCP